MEREQVKISLVPDAKVWKQQNLNNGMPTHDQLELLNALYGMDVKRGNGRNGQSNYHTGDSKSHFDETINSIVKANLMADIQRERGRRWKGDIKTSRVGASKTQLRLRKKWEEKYNNGKKLTTLDHIITHKAQGKF